MQDADDKIIICYPGTFTVKSGMAKMVKGGIIMDVTSADEAKIAEEAGVLYTVLYCIQLYTEL